MGFLDHSTNNIIVDAVLTDRGREALANGTFNVTQFSLGDDEVDYTIIQKYGRTVGKEKIIKNTPVFEAQTLSQYALKNKLLTIADPTFIYLPQLTLSGDVNADVVSIVAQNNETKTITVKQTIEGTANTTAVTRDDQFYIEVPDRFLVLQSAANVSQKVIARSTNTATYLVTATTPTDGSALKSVELTFTTQGGLDDTVFQTFSTNAARNRIDCVVGIVGRQTGLRKTISFQIDKNTSS